MRLGIGIGIGRRIGGGASAPLLPTEVGLQAHWLADRGITLTGSDVTSWTDAFAGGVLGDPGVGNRPSFSATGFNSLPGVTFDGVSERLSIASALGISGNPPALNYTIYIAKRAISTAGNATFLALSHGADHNVNWARMSTAGPAERYQIVHRDASAASNATNSGAGTLGTTTPRVICQRVTAGSLQLFRDGTEILAPTALDALGAITPNAFTLGALLNGAAGIGNFSNMVTGEIAVFSVAHDDTTRDAVRAAIQTRWGL